MRKLIRLTDRKGRLTQFAGRAEPEPGSVVLTEGEYGTAWQRFFHDGMWHPARGGPAKTWGYLLSKRNVYLVYEAEVRTERAG